MLMQTFGLVKRALEWKVTQEPSSCICMEFGRAFKSPTSNMADQILVMPSMFPKYYVQAGNDWPMIKELIK